MQCEYSSCQQLNIISYLRSCILGLFLVVGLSFSSIAVAENKTSLNAFNMSMAETSKAQKPMQLAHFTGRGHRHGRKRWRGRGRTRVNVFLGTGAIGVGYYGGRRYGGRRAYNCKGWFRGRMRYGYIGRRSGLCYVWFRGGRIGLSRYRYL